MQHTEAGERAVLTWLAKTPVRLTRLRVNVGRVLMTAPEPPTAEELYQQLLRWDESVSLGSVYRILKEWEDSGLVTRKRHLSNPGSEAVYQINGQPKVMRAFVFQCPACGRQQRFTDTALAEHLAHACQQQRFQAAGDFLIAAVCQACTPHAAPHPSNHAPATAEAAVPPSQPDSQPRTRQ